VPLPGVLAGLLARPTAPFVESAVASYIADFCRKTPGVSLETDRCGNLLARYRYRPRGTRPLAFAAHMDHPGFIAQQQLEAHKLRAAFRGGVRSEYFRQAGVRFWSNGGWVEAQVRAVVRARQVRRGSTTWQVPEEVVLRVARPVAYGSPGVWDLPEAQEREGRVYARGCDDSAGCAALLELLRRLSRRRARAEAYCLFTRAEEVGFIGAIGAARAGTIPKRVPIISIETSSELPHARIGDGPILRVGDRLSVFDPGLSAFCERVATGCAGRCKGFRYQRKLMDGGACEATAFAAYGYRAGGICLALGNYHNMNTAARRIDCEYVSLGDWKLMVDWFEALVLDEAGYRPADETQRRELDQSFARWRPLLRRPSGHDAAAAR